MFIDDFLAFAETCPPARGGGTPARDGFDSVPLPRKWLRSVTRVPNGSPCTTSASGSSLARSSRWWGPTGRARRRWPSCWPGCTCRLGGGSAGTAGTRVTWTGARCSAAARSCSRISSGTRCPRGTTSRSGGTSRVPIPMGIVRAAEQAERRDISALPFGTRRCSGRRASTTDPASGQWQRLALARTFFRDAPLVILDDQPTAALDAKAEHELFAKIGELFQDRSVLLISHRFSTVHSADRRRLSEGYVVEAGPTRSCWPGPGPTPSCSRCRRRRTSAVKRMSRGVSPRGCGLRRRARQPGGAATGP